MKKNKTHFGYEEVPSQEKEFLVKKVFDSVAENYDLMNDLMSFGLHRLWKRFVGTEVSIKNKDLILDLASGSGDLPILFKTKNKKAQVIHSDINQDMLEEGKKKIIDKGLIIPSILINAENIPFAENSFNLITIGFGLRNMTDKDKVLKEIYRCLKPGGKLIILEFSKINPLLKKPYDFFSFNIIPKLGKIITNDKRSYRYLSESIRMHPDQEELLKMIKENNFIRCRYQNLTAGIVAIHSGYKP